MSHDNISERLVSFINDRPISARDVYTFDVDTLRLVYEKRKQFKFRFRRYEKRFARGKR